VAARLGETPQPPVISLCRYLLQPDTLRSLGRHAGADSSSIRWPTPASILFQYLSVQRIGPANHLAVGFPAAVRRALLICPAPARLDT